MLFKIEVIQVRSLYIVQIVSSCVLNSKKSCMEIENKFSSTSKKTAVAEYQRILKDISPDYFRVVSMGEGNLPYCMMDTETKQMKTLVFKEEKQ